MKLSEDVLEIFDEHDFERILRILGRDLGNITLSEIKECYEQVMPAPSKEIDGKLYFAGYGGRYKVAPGIYTAKLLKIIKDKNSIKLLMGIEDNLYLYFTKPKDTVSVSSLVDLFNISGTDITFRIRVAHQTIANTGEHHAIITAFLDKQGKEYNPYILGK